MGHKQARAGLLGRSDPECINMAILQPQLAHLGRPHPGKQFVDISTAAMRNRDKHRQRPCLRCDQGERGLIPIRSKPAAMHHTAGRLKVGKLGKFGVLRHCIRVLP